MLARACFCLLHFGCTQCVVSLLLVVSTTPIDCLETLISELTYYVKWDAKPYTLTHILSDYEYRAQAVQAELVVICK